MSAIRTPLPFRAPPTPATTPEEPIPVDAVATILAAIKDLDAKVTGVLQAQAGHAEWRKAVDDDRAEYKREIEELKKSDHKRELSLVKITAWSAGVAAAVTAFGWIVAHLPH